jgi:hypothetical protein
MSSSAPAPASFRQHLRDLADLALLVDVAHGDMGEARVGAQGGGKPRGKEGVAAKIGEEVGVAQDRLAGEQGGQCCEQRFLGGRFGRSESSALAAGGALSGVAFSALRSILPEVRRGMASSISYRPGTMYGGSLAARPARAACAGRS